MRNFINTQLKLFACSFIAGSTQPQFLLAAGVCNILSSKYVQNLPLFSEQLHVL